MKKLTFLLLIAACCFTGCKFNTDFNRYFTVKSDPAGIKITIAKNVTFQEAGGSTISVDGCPLKIGNLHAYNTKQIIYPFTEKGETYKVYLAASISTNNGRSYKWVDIAEKCKAGGGTDYKQYLNLDPVIYSTLDINYVANNNSFTGTYTIAGTDIIKDRSKVSIKIPVEVILGEQDWSNTKWVTYATRFDETDLTSTVIPFTSAPTDVTSYDWTKYNHKYSAYASPLLVFTDFNKIQFETERIFTAVKTYY